MLTNICAMKDDIKMENSSALSFVVNGKEYRVNDVDPAMKLNTWLRSQPGLTGTKVMCQEGGCGCCTVALETESGHIKAVNSCLVMLGSIDGCKITTTEGIGSRRDGFHRIQSRLADFGGSQCGYCTPGFVMNMYSLLSKKPSATQRDIEDSFDGNICRCTGYRPILDAMKSFASDADPKLLENCCDIEDLGKQCSNCTRSGPPTFLKIEGDTTWYRPVTIHDLKKIFQSNSNVEPELVCGNTASGVYKRTVDPKVLVDISKLESLLVVKQTDDSYTFGASVTLAQLIDTLSADKGSALCSKVAKHIRKIASVPVRNLGSWAGNLMIKYHHREFPSDMFVLLECLQAQIEILDVAEDKTVTCSASELLDMEMQNKVIVQMTLKRNISSAFESFKIMPRSQNAHAHVNAAFRADMSDDKLIFKGQPSLVFGGINLDFVHAKNTEQFLNGKPINSQSTFAESISILAAEVQPIQFDAVDTNVQYKHDLALSLYYKFYLSLCDPNQLNPGIASGLTSLERPVSSGTQTFDDDPDMFPVTQAIPKLASRYQASGEAVFISDKIPSPEELHCAFVTSDTGNADIDEIDDTQASKMPGFVQLITGSSMPSDVYNTYLYPYDITQPLLAIEHVDFAGQPLAIVIAETREQARKIAGAVKVTYKNQQKPLLTVKDAIEAKSFFDFGDSVTESGNTTEALKTAKHKVSGEFHLAHQYHFYMETQVARARTTEEGGFNLEIATQSQKLIQDLIAFAFKTSANKVEVSTKRIGGAYGGKATNSLIVGMAAALASHCARRPVCFHADLKTCMTAFGTRTPFSIYYNVGFDDNGMLEVIDCDLYTNSGPTYHDGEADDLELMHGFGDSAYRCDNRRYRKFMCITNIPSSTWCRAPGSIQLTGFLDQMLEHVASYLGKDPIDVKEANFYREGDVAFNGLTLKECNLQKIHKKLMEGGRIKQRQSEVSDFNEKNKWKKRGIAVSSMRYMLDATGGKYTVLVSVCADDGTVIVSHGGIESGQGINTKVAQVAAFAFGIPIDDVMVQRANSVTSSNSASTGGSVTSEVACKTVLECCKILKSRIDPIRMKMDKSSRWRDVIARCFHENVDLQASHLWIPPPDTSRYSIYGSTAAEVELDVLTGEYLINQVDLVFDCGVSLNPSVDIGQVEGAFVMGLGFWLWEKYVLDEETGRLLNDGTWEYNVPTSKDIPVRWNIELLKNAPNPVGVLRSKASGEPPMCMSISVLNALKRAVEASRRDRGLDGFFQMPMPATVDKLRLALDLNPAQHFTLL